MCVHERQPDHTAERGTPSDGLAALHGIKAATIGDATICVRGRGAGGALCPLGSDGFTSVYWLRDTYVASTLPVLEVSTYLQGTLYIK